MTQWLRRLRAVPELLLAYGILRADVEQALSDPQILAAANRFLRDPHIAPMKARIAAEWRAVEEALKKMR
jgi:hypothetical protein